MSLSVATLLRRLLVKPLFARSRKRAGYRPRLEGLEDRTVPALILSQVNAVLATPTITASTPLIGSTSSAIGAVSGEVGSEVGQTLLHVCHRTCSDKNPFVLLGIRHDNPAVMTHLLDGDIVFHYTLAADGSVATATIQFLPTDTLANITAAIQASAGASFNAADISMDASTTVVSVSGTTAAAVLNGLPFRQGESGHDDCVTLATRLGLSLDVCPGRSLTHVGDDERIFVADLYDTSLGRDASDHEIDFWLGVLHGAGRSEVINGIDNSAEAMQHLVDSWYQLYLNRDATGGEEMAWVGLLQQGVSRQQVLAGILGSPEFIMNSGNTAGGYIHELYETLLNREASDAEISAWLGTLQFSGSAAVASAIIGSAEFRADTIEALYFSTLGRHGGSTEIAGWMSTNLDLNGLRHAFLSSAEFVQGD
jgi:hypothetical protein